MKKLLYALLFIFLTLFFLYLSFPFERFIGDRLCERGISYADLKVSKIPLRIEIDSLRVPSLPFKVEKLVLKPSFKIFLLRGPVPIAFEGALCGGKVEGELTYLFSNSYSLKDISYRVSGLKVETCLNSPFLSGELASYGSLTFEEGNLMGGSGKFSMKNLTLKPSSLALVKEGELFFEKAEGTYGVKGRNLVEIEAQGEGGDGSFKVKGEVNYNPRAPLYSYGSFRIKVKLEKEPFNGKEFDFTVRGNLKDLRF